MSVSILADTIEDLEKYFLKLPDIATDAARLAINDVAANEGLAILRNEVYQEIAFPKGYLEEDRLKLRRRATNSRLEAVISARDRATSLARFATGQTPANTRGKGVSIEVKRGSRKLLKKAFLVNLNNGNTGLAIRLKPGEKIGNKREMKMVAFGKGAYLLYGPSVDQVFRDVADQAAPEIGNMVAKEFFRQFTRLSRG